ncbi:MAG: alpha/beta fold hydrolase [Candidatus Eremiobacteraeota bacterium]|nr:alpha/beta fold hydrolase [Candidatus Eremiobacteraeota bacterium]
MRTIHVRLSAVLLFIVAVITAGIVCAAAADPFKETAVSVAIPGASLSGTLTLPEGSGPFPVALIIAGSGPIDRDGNSAGGITSDAYKLLAHGLASHGIATLRYDKRGVGSSVVTMAESQLRFDDFVNDALAWTHFLEKDRRFRRVAIVGHSEGSLIGMVAAQRDPNVAAFVSLEGPGRRLSDIIEEQIRASGASQQIVDEVVSADKLLVAGEPVPSPDPQLAALFRPSVQPYLISEYKYDPAVEIAKLTIPVAIVQGTTDIQTGVVDAKRLAAADKRAKLDLIDGMNHMLRDAPVDRIQNLATYSEPSLPLDTRLLPMLATFLQ